MKQVRTEVFVEQVVEGLKYRGSVKLDASPGKIGVRFTFKLTFEIPINERHKGGEFHLSVKRNEKELCLEVNDLAFFTRVILEAVVKFYYDQDLKNRRAAEVYWLEAGTGEFVNGDAASAARTIRNDIMPKSFLDTIYALRFGQRLATT